MRNKVAKNNIFSPCICVQPYTWPSNIRHIYKYIVCSGMIEWVDGVLHRCLQVFRFFKIFQNSPFLLPWQPEFCMEWNSLNNFESPSPKDHSYQVWLDSIQYFGRRCRLKKLWTDGQTDDGLPAITIVHFEHFVLRWTNKQEGHDGPRSLPWVHH